MKERPILFSGAMVRAILAGTKTQTRRVVKFPRAPKHLGQWEPTTTGGPSNGKVVVGGQLVPNPEPEEVAMWHTSTCAHVWCPHGRSGDRLWVRETSADFCDLWPHWCGCGSTERRAQHHRVIYAADGGDHERTGWRNKWTPSIHMPRWASRLTLAVESVRVERLQDISEEDARAEGISKFPLPMEEASGFTVHAVEWPSTTSGETARAAFASLWESINSERPGCSWEANPWVWCVEFKVEEVRR